MQGTAGEVGTTSEAMYSCVPLHMDEQRQHDQLEPRYNRSVPIQDVALKTFQERRTIEKRSGRGPGRSAQEAQQDNDDIYIYIYIYIRQMCKWLKKTPIYILMYSISLNFVKSLLDKQKLWNSFLVGKNNIKAWIFQGGKVHEAICII